MMQGFTIRCVLVCLLALGCIPTAFAEKVQPAGVDTGQDSAAEFAAATAAYRAGDYAGAKARWTAILAREGGNAQTSERRGLLCYNLGNAAYRAGEPMEAIAWYRAALRHLPRSGDVRANLNFVRGEIGLPPAEGDSMLSTVRHAFSAWTPSEARRMALMALALLALILGMEALRGGALWRGLAWASAIVLVVCCVPWALNALDTDEPRSMVASERAITGRSEPRPDGRALVRLDPAAVVYPVGEWQDWTKVRTSEGKDVWVQTGKLHSVWF